MGSSGLPLTTPGKEVLCDSPRHNKDKYLTSQTNRGGEGRRVRTNEVLAGDRPAQR